MKKLLIFMALCCFGISATASSSGSLNASLKHKAYTKENYPVKKHHDELGFDCKTCHGNGPEKEYKNLTTKDCFSCHKDYESLAKRSGQLGYDDNVHASPHYPEMDCNACHSTHQQSKNYCVMCHSQDSMKNIKVP